MLVFDARSGSTHLIGYAAWQLFQSLVESRPMTEPAEAALPERDALLRALEAAGLVESC